MSLTKIQAELYKCPLLNKNCITHECMMWQWTLMYAYQNNNAEPTLLNEKEWMGSCSLSKKSNSI